MKIFKKIIVCLLVLALVACGTNGNNETVDNEKSKLEKIKESKLMVFATSADYPPFEFHSIIDGEDKVVGFEVEIAKLLAEDLGVELEIQDVDFHSMLTGVEKGMYDIGLAGINPSPEREKVLNFSDVYYEVEFTVLTRKNDKDKFNSLDDLNNINLGVQNGTIQADVASENFDSNIVQLGKVTDLVLQLQSGMIDAIILEVPVAESYVTNNSDLQIAESINISDLDFDSGVVAAFTKGEDDFVEYFNEFIKKHQELGTFEKLYTEAVELNENNQ